MSVLASGQCHVSPLPPPSLGGARTRVSSANSAVWRAPRPQRAPLTRSTPRHPKTSPRLQNARNSGRVRASSTAQSSSHVSESASPSIAAVQRLAELRCTGTRLLPPLVDPYATHLCYSSQDGTQGGDEPVLSPADVAYLTSTRHLDDAIASLLSDPAEEVRQVVLVSAGADVDATRAFRLPLPRMTCVFDVSPADAYEWATQKLKDAGVKLPPGTVLRHVSADVSEGDDWRDEGWGEKVVRMGYRGDRKSIWVLQDCGRLSAEGMTSALGHVRGLAKKGSSFLGQVNASHVLGEECHVDVDERETVSKLRSLFAQFGFSVDFVSISERWGGSKEDDEKFEYRLCDGSFVFRAVQQRLSDIEMEEARKEILRAMEDEGEEGFEDAP